MIKTNWSSLSNDIKERVMIDTREPIYGLNVMKEI